MSVAQLDGGAFIRDGEALFPQPWTRSGWGPNMLMGRYLCGLIALGAERHAADDLQPARMTVDMFRPAPVGRTIVETRVVRDGRRIRVVDIDVVVDDDTVCRGTVVFLRRSADPDEAGWSPAPHPLPDPLGLVKIDGRSGWRPSWDQRPFGTWGALEGDRGCWMRETEAFVQGEPLTPFLQVALAVDNTNGTLNAHPRGLPFINADLTLTLAALPVTPWIGLNPVSRAVADGVSVGVVDVYDSHRRIGQVSMIGLADHRNGTPPRAR